MKFVKQYLKKVQSYLSKIHFPEEKLLTFIMSGVSSATHTDSD